jgi:hypothetical protein
MHDVDKLTPGDPSDLAAALAFALRYQCRKRVHNANETMAEIRRKAEHLERAGFVVMKPPAVAFDHSICWNPHREVATLRATTQWNFWAHDHFA